MKKILIFTGIVIATITGMLISGDSSFDDIEIGDGFYLRLKGAASVLHIPGNSQLRYRNEKGKSKLVWSYTVGKLIVTNRYIIFNGGLTDDRIWKSSPALFIFKDGKPPVEISEGLTRLHAKNNAITYEDIQGKYVYEWPEMTNKVIFLKGQKKVEAGAYDTNSDWIDIKVTLEELRKVSQDVESRASVEKYEGVNYLIEKVKN